VLEELELAAGPGGIVFKVVGPAEIDERLDCHTALAEKLTSAVKGEEIDGRQPMYQIVMS
jgi:hypothetical protein